MSDTISLSNREWNEYMLVEITEPIKETFVPNGMDDLNYIGLEYIEQQTLRLNAIGSSNDVTSTKFLFKANDILFGKLRVYFRKVTKPKFNGICSTDIWVFRAKKGFDQNFLFYFLANWDFINTADGGEGGTRMPRADWNFLSTTKWTVPPPPEQKAIASVLSSLDDKIDLLHRQNKTLEAMAETLFRQWFIEEADESWEEDELKNLVDVVDNRGKTPPNFETRTEYPLIEANALNGEERLVNYSLIKKYVAEDTFNNWFRDSLSKYDTLITTVGANIGAMAMFILERGNIAQNIIGLTARKVSSYYLYEVLKYLRNEILQMDIGGVQPSIKVPHLLSLNIPIPPKERELRFINSMSPIVSKMEFNYLQISSLEKLRDTLLPKLMSGEVRVK